MLHQVEAIRHVTLRVPHPMNPFLYIYPKFKFIPKKNKKFGKVFNIINIIIVNSRLNTVGIHLEFHTNNFSHLIKNNLIYTTKCYNFKTRDVTLTAVNIRLLNNIFDKQRQNFLKKKTTKNTTFNSLKKWQNTRKTKFFQKMIFLIAQRCFWFIYF